MKFHRLNSIFSFSFIALMAIQAVLGLVYSGAYRDIEWIKLTWYGNDLVSILLAIPIFIVAQIFVGRGSVRAEVLRLGVFAYGVYNYSFYLFGAALNAFFPIYSSAFLLSCMSLGFGLMTINFEQYQIKLEQRTYPRIIGGYYLFVAVGLEVIWLGMWAAYVFANVPTPVESEAFKIVAALDTTLMVPALAIGGILLWRHHRYGIVLSAIAGIQGSLYLIVLSTNSVVAIIKQVTPWPGELPIWGSLCVFTLCATVLLFTKLIESGPNQLFHPTAFSLRQWLNFLVK